MWLLVLRGRGSRGGGYLGVDVESVDPGNIPIHLSKSLRGSVRAEKDNVIWPLETRGNS